MLLFLLSLFTSLPVSQPPVKQEKPKYMWFDAEANFRRFSSRDSIRYYLDKTKAAGFNQVVVDVRPIYGDVLYRKTKTMQVLTRLGNYTRTGDWDYLQEFITEARKRNLKVSVSATIFPAGRPATREGMAYRSPEWGSRTMREHTPTGWKDIRDDRKKVAAFLNPLLPETQQLALGFIREIVSNYDMDGFVLDYCRFADIETDFSDYTRARFEAYIGHKLAHFPDDIFRWENGARKDGPYARQWFEFRAKVIHDFVKLAKETIKSIKPQVKLEYWAASWYGALYEKGQNWASKTYNPAKEYGWASEGYRNTGFAEHLDVFMNGVYLDKVYGANDPESIEYGLERGRRLIDGACKMYGSVYALNKGSIEDAVYLCLKRSEGLVVFDVVQVIELGLWEKLKKGIERAER